MFPYIIMGQEAIQKQIEVIRKASANARTSPEAARQFLIDAGIIKSRARVVARPKD